jgi:hypothetical protein
LHLKAKSAILNENGFDAIVRSKVEAIVVFDFEGRINWEEGIKRIWFCRHGPVELIANGDDAVKKSERANK